MRDCGNAILNASFLFDYPVLTTLDLVRKVASNNWILEKSELINRIRFLLSLIPSSLYSYVKEKWERWDGCAFFQISKKASIKPELLKQMDSSLATVICYYCCLV